MRQGCNPSLSHLSWEAEVHHALLNKWPTHLVEGFHQIKAEAPQRIAILHRFFNHRHCREIELLNPPVLQPTRNALWTSEARSLLYVLYVLYLTRQAAEPPLFPNSLLYVLYVLYLTRQAAEPPLFPGSLLYVLYVLYLTRQAAEPPLSPGCVLYVLYLTRQAAEPPLSPSSLLYVLLYVLYTLYARNLYYICYIGPYSTYSTYSKEPGESGCSVACLVRYSTYSTYSKEPGESGCSVACLVRYSTVGRALRGAPPHAEAPGGAVLPVLGRLQQLGARGP